MIPSLTTFDQAKHLSWGDMTELLPNSWRFQEQEAKCCHQQKNQRSGRITDILICYSALVATLSTRFPDKTPQFMPYLSTIVKAQRTFSGEGWVMYDACYHRKAAATKSLEWGTIDFTLYNETFTGRAKALARCRYCSSDLHATHECAFAPPGPSSGGVLRVGNRPPTRSQGEICQLYNTRSGNRCHFNPCRFTHACSDCRGRHPVSQCWKGSRPEKCHRREEEAERRRR